MCRSIKTLRPPYTDDVTVDDMHAAALQYVRKISGMRAPAKANVEAFELAVAAVTDATRELLATIQVRPPRVSSAPDGHTHDGHTHDGHTHDGHTHGHTHDAVRRPRPTSSRAG